MGICLKVKNFFWKSPNLADVPARIITLEPTEVLQDLGSTRRWNLSEEFIASI